MMRVGFFELYVIFMVFILPILCVVGIFFAIKYLIRYNAQQKAASNKPSEIERMKIDDLE